MTEQTIAMLEEALRQAITQRDGNAKAYDHMRAMLIAAEELIADLRTGAEEQSQSHADVLAKIAAWERRKASNA